MRAPSMPSHARKFERDVLLYEGGLPIIEWFAE